MLHVLRVARAMRDSRHNELLDRIYDPDSSNPVKPNDVDQMH